MKDFFTKPLNIFWALCGAGILVIAILLGSQAYQETLKFRPIEKIPPATEYNMTDPIVAAGYENLKKAYTELDKYKGKDLQQAPILDPALERANAYLQMHDTGRAMLAYEWINKYRPGGIQGFVNLGNLYRQVGEYKKAEAQYLIAIKNSQGHHTDPYEAIWELYRDNLKEDTDKIEPIMLTATQQTPDQANFWLILAQYYELKNRTGDAITAYKKILAINPNNPQIREKIKQLGG